MGIEVEIDGEELRELLFDDSSSMRQALGELGVTFDDELPDFSGFVKEGEQNSYDDDNVAQWIEDQANTLARSNYVRMCSLGQSVADAIRHRVRTDLIDPDRINDEELLLIARRMMSVLYEAGEATLVPVTEVETRGEEQRREETLGEALDRRLGEQEAAEGAPEPEEPWYVAEETTRRSTDGTHVCYTPEGALWGPYPTMDEAIVASKESNMTTFVFQRSQLLGHDDALKTLGALFSLDPEAWVATVDDTPSDASFNWSTYGPFDSQEEARVWGRDVNGSMTTYQVKDLLTVHLTSEYPVKKV